MDTNWELFSSNTGHCNEIVVEAITPKINKYAR
jgi:hypothetical protein